MGDYFERIVDVEATEEEARPIAERMVDWMVSEGLITLETSDDGVFSHPVDKGYVPGPHWARAVAEPPTPNWRPGPVAVIVGRGYYVGGQGVDTAANAVCPRCQSNTVIIDYPQEFEPDLDAWQPFEDGIAAWKETGVGSASCPTCDARIPVTQWQWEPNFTLGALAFDFWNWPALSTGFCATFSQQLGHRVAEQGGKV